MQLSFNVDKNVLSRTDKETLVANSKNYATAKFNFSDDWIGKAKTVCFSRDKQSYSVLLDENCICQIPNEVMAEAGGFRVAVLGVGDNVAIPTTNAVVAHVYAGYNSDEESDKVESLNILEQVLNKFAAFEQNVVDPEIISECVNSYLESHKIKTDFDVDELSSTIATSISEYFREHKDEFVGPPGQDGQPGTDGKPGKDGKPGTNGRNGRENMVVQNNIDVETDIYTIYPNQLYVFDFVPSEFEIVFAEPTDLDIVNEYHFILTSPESGVQLTLPSTVHRGDFVVEPNYIYEVSVVNDLLVYSRWSVES